MSDIEKLDLASENQRLRERVEELEADASASSAEDERGHALIDDADGEDERTTSMSTLAERVEALLDQRERLRDDATKAEAERVAALAQVAVLREALEGVANSVANEHLATDGRFSYAFHDAIKAVEAALASTPAPTRAEAEAWLRAGEPVRGALAVPAEPDYSGLCAAPSCEAVREYLADHGGEPYRAPSPPDILRRVAERAMAWLRAGEPVRGALAVPAEPDYSGLCAAPSCEGHCGYVHARGCEAVREYLADHGGEPYRAPSPPDILRRVAERARERIAALAYDAGRPDLCARVRAIDLNVLLDGGE